LSVVAIDIDHFKRVNDTFGHPVRDRVLIEVSEVLQGVARKSEVVARLGGEEFLWILPRSAAPAAARAAERARRAVAEHDFGVGPVTISLGVCSTGSEYDRDALVAAADVALYEAKAAGRDRVRARGPHAPAARSRRRPPLDCVEPRRVHRAAADVSG
jgi:diguanylate cyclase (GGDEF)-like protein